ncbi:MAG: N-formylglutamate amidohydrolase [bacterium]|nr:N-formylglutamate amidohydrolase [bacterium]
MNQHPILITIPHCSFFVPVELRRLMCLTDFDIKAHSDLFTDQIFDVPAAHLVKAKISRLVADPNRAPDDILMESHLSADGVVVSVTEDGKPIYREPPNEAMIRERVAKYHLGFHEEVDQLAPRMKFLIDGHSLKSRGSKMKDDAGQQRADIVLGNRDYTTCDRQTTVKIYRFFQERGFSVKVNDPYSGKYVIGHHCSRRKLPGIQVEVNRKLYMNEKTLRRSPTKIKQLNEVMKALVEALAKEL